MILVIAIARKRCKEAMQGSGRFFHAKGLVLRVDTSYIMGVIDVPFAIATRQSAKEDIRDILARDRSAGMAIVHWLERAKEDQEIMDQLWSHGHEDEEISVSKFQALQGQGLNAWRIKLRKAKDWLPYRILYAYDHINLVFYVLRVVPRPPFDYDRNDSVTNGCINDIKKLGIPSRYPN